MNPFKKPDRKVDDLKHGGAKSIGIIVRKKDLKIKDYSKYPPIPESNK
jgi:hypothetical protein